jgi:hypothetical protein
MHSVELCLRRGKDVPPTVFFGYPSKPAMRADTIREGSNTLQARKLITAVRWEELKVAGRYVIDQIQAAIKSADVAGFDVTKINHNVMFELGFAIGANRKIWLFRDISDAQSQRNWDRIKMLTTIGYSPVVSAQDLIDEWNKQRPDLTPDTVFERSISESLADADRPSLFYLLGLHQTDAERKIYRRIRDEEAAGIFLRFADPVEAAVLPLTWYAQQIYASEAVVAHLTSPERVDADVHNARCAFVSGLASGMGKPVFMLAEGDFLTPIDYRDLAFNYPSAAAAARRAGEWLDAHLLQARTRAAAGTIRARSLSLLVGLRQLRLGDPVAENETDSLAEYFVETAAYDDLIEDRQPIFVGRKGTGKTANLLAAADQLEGDKRNLVVVIKPYSYELESIGELVKKYREIGEQGYLIESLWKFLIYSEIARQAYERLARLPQRPDERTSEGVFMEFVEQHEDWLLADFAVRLEAAVDSLRAAARAVTGVGERRTRIAEALHGGLLQQLRDHLGRALSDRQRVAVLIDNLDKAWSPAADLDNLSQFLLGLLSSVGRIQDELRKPSRSNERIAVTLAVFLRSDIFARVKQNAREPDKLPISRLQWSDPELLMRVLEERYRASQPNAEEGELWTKYFCETIRDKSTPVYILERILPRPRDLIYFCRAAISTAVNRGHPRVETSDVDEAELAYSQFAFESLQVENGISLELMEDILYEFFGGSASITSGSLFATLRNAGVEPDDFHNVIEHLYALSFLGVEIEDRRIYYARDADDETATKAQIRRRLELADGKITFWVHPAFRRYLEIKED